MRRKIVSLIAIAVMLILAGGDLAEAKKSRRSSRVSAKKSSVKKSSRAKAGRSRAAKIVRGKNSRRSRRGRVARSRRSKNYLPASNAADAPRVASTGISPERVAEIQEALIKRGYLEGPASTQYDDKTVDAMKRFQADNKLAGTGQPSAHALKKLGVSKRNNDGYAVPVSNVIEKEKKPAPPSQ